MEEESRDERPRSVWGRCFGPLLLCCCPSLRRRRYMTQSDREDDSAELLRSSLASSPDRVHSPVPVLAPPYRAPPPGTWQSQIPANQTKGVSNSMIIGKRSRDSGPRSQSRAPKSRFLGKATGRCAANGGPVSPD